MSSLKIHNPYQLTGFSWLRGNLHAHSTLSDGRLPPQLVVDQYAAAGHDFLALTDHDIHSDSSTLDPAGLILLPGNEISANAQHVLHIGSDRRIEPDSDRQSVLDAINATSGFSILAHPTWQDEYDYYPRELMLKLQGYLGIEIFNEVINQLNGSALAVNQWDWLLSQGRQVYGFANDDSHFPENIARGWNVVQAETNDAAGITAAFRAGRFYASTGVEISSISASGRYISVHTANAHRIALVTNLSRRVAAVDSNRALFEIPEGFKGNYVRIECWGHGEQQAWSQPLFVTTDGTPA